MYAHERSLVSKYQGQPFALLAVDVTEDPEKLRQLMRDREITWRSWWDADTAIGKQWKIEGLPTLFLIDARGTIRETYLGNPGDATLDAAIERLLREIAS